MVGYSKTPLHRKLGLKDGMLAIVINPPANYHSLLGPDAPDTHWSGGPIDRHEFVHCFSKSRAELDEFLTIGRHAIAGYGMIWVSWPKRASKVATDITEDAIREIALPMGLVDIKVCAVDEVWSGLKLVIRKELR